MQIQIPKELLQYVRMSKSEGLIHRPNMPEELIPLFEETKKIVQEKQQLNKTELERLLIKEEN